MGIGEIWRRLFAKCVLKVAGTEAKETCGSAQFCADLEADIEGAVHAVRSMWNGAADNEEREFLLVDAANAFNAVNRTAILWTVRHSLPSGARFGFNYYRHWSQLDLRQHMRELEDYEVVPDMLEVDITADTVTEVAAKLSGAGGPGGVDAIALQQWLLRYGVQSHSLREAVAEFTRWMTNDTPPWV